uniref:Uncharacterized protein n=1 Tax=Panagrolaimus sp. JU765 TaxID=591449 RepID=A0AC34QVQ3_9BILA
MRTIFLTLAITIGAVVYAQINAREPAQKVHRWFRRVNRFTNTDQCEPYVFPLCSDLDFNLWRSPRSREECELYCYSVEEQRRRGII